MHTIPCHITPHHAQPCHEHTIPYHSIRYHTISYPTTSHHTTPYHTIPYHTIPPIPHPTLLLCLMFLNSHAERSRFSADRAAWWWNSGLHPRYSSGLCNKKSRLRIVVEGQRPTLTYTTSYSSNDFKLLIQTQYVIYSASPSPGIVVPHDNPPLKVFGEVVLLHVLLGILLRVGSGKVTYFHAEYIVTLK